MNLFTWIRRRGENRRRGDREITISAKAVFDDDISKITCFAGDCYFNQKYKGKFSCNLKSVQIDAAGYCMDFCDRRCVVKSIQQKREIGK